MYKTLEELTIKLQEVLQKDEQAILCYYDGKSINRDYIEPTRDDKYDDWDSSGPVTVYTGYGDDCYDVNHFNSVRDYIDDEISESYLNECNVFKVVD